MIELVRETVPQWALWFLAAICVCVMIASVLSKRP
jgi:hypothetical protein